MFSQAAMSAISVMYSLDDDASPQASAPHEVFGQATARYSLAVIQAGVLLDAVVAGDPQASLIARELARSVLQHAGSDALVSTRVDPPGSPRQLRAMQALDAAVIAAAVGRRLRLPDTALHELTMAALLHAVGIDMLPESMQNEFEQMQGPSRIDFVQYPLLGAEAIEACGGFSTVVSQLVAQHRERLDGRGFPHQLRDSEFHRHACIIGAVREYQLRAVRDRSVMPSAALARLYVGLRRAYGEHIIDSLIATLTVYPPGSFLALSDGSIGRVLKVSHATRLQPIVCLYKDDHPPTKAPVVDLARKRELSVLCVLDPEKLAPAVIDFFGGGWGGIAFHAAPG